MEQPLVTCISTLQRNLTYLLSIADKKAGVLMGANFLVISILISHIAVKGFMLILCIPLLFSLFLIFLSMRVLSPKFVESRSLPGNLFFFRYINTLSPDNYHDIMKRTLLDDDLLYEALLMDCYQVSMILEKKHKLLQMCFYATYLFIACISGTVITVFAVKAFDLL